MRTKRFALYLSKVALVIFWLLIISLALAAPVLGAPGNVPVPDGFKLVKSKNSVSLYEKNYPGGSPDYVQVADISLGAQIGVLHGKVTKSGQGSGVYGGDNAFFGRLSIQQFWRNFANSTGGAFCVTNGQFFHLADSPTPMPFPLKVNGKILTDGYDINNFQNQKLMLEIWPDHLDIRDLSKDNLYNSTAPDIVAGLTEDAEKASKRAVGRTFVGVRDQNGDNLFETLLIFNTSTAKPPAAAKVLRDFGAQKVMMLDGGGSTQLVCSGNAIINTDRLIPQALGIADGQPNGILASSNQTQANAAQAASESASNAVAVNTNQQITGAVSQPEAINMDQQNLTARAQTDTVNPVLQASDTQTQIEPIQSPQLQANSQPNGKALAQGTDNSSQVQSETNLTLPLYIPQEQQPFTNMAGNGTQAASEQAQPQQTLSSSEQQGSQVKKRISTGESNSSTARIAYQPTNRSGEHVNIMNAIWIPLFMLPVVLILVLTIRRAQQN